MVPYIPLELVHLIASAALAVGNHPVEDERSARSKLAKNLSLVCRAWRPVGQAALFGTFKLYVGQQDGFLRDRQRSHLFSFVRELVVPGNSSSAKMDKNIVRCRRECDQLRRLCLDNPLAWSVWFARTRRPAPVASVAEFSIGESHVSEKRAPDLVSVLKGASLLPEVTKFAIRLTAASDPGPALPDLAGSAPWSKVQDLAVSIVQAPQGQLHKTFLRELPNLFLLDRLASLDLEQVCKADLDSYVVVLQRTTSLRRLGLGCLPTDLSRVADAVGPVLAGMTSLEVFKLRATDSLERRSGGKERLPASLFANLPRTLVVVDVDLRPDSAAEQAFLEDRLGSPLEAWTTTKSAWIAPRHNEVVYAIARWVKRRDERDGTRAWAREV
ncbi:hypothetical protein JCM3775_000541 [Rhodotorula graminis]